MIFDGYIFKDQKIFNHGNPDYPDTLQKLKLYHLIRKNVVALSKNAVESIKKYEKTIESVIDYIDKSDLFTTLMDMIMLNVPASIKSKMGTEDSIKNILIVEINSGVNFILNKGSKNFEGSFEAEFGNDLPISSIPGSVVSYHCSGLKISSILEIPEEYISISICPIIRSIIQQSEQ